jgi:O-antigen ligase
MRWLRATPGNAVVFKLHITHGILMALAALLFALYARDAGRMAIRVAWAIASGLAVFNVLFMVQGRSGYLMLAALLVLVLIARWRWRGGLAALLVVLAGSAVVYQASAPLRMRVDLALSEYRQWDRQVPARIESSIGLRLEFIDVSLSLVRERPWLGYGVGSFPWAYREKVAGSGRVATANPHNEMLLLAVQGGLPAVALFLFLMTRLLACATRLPTPRERLMAAALTIWLFIGGLPNALLIDHTESLVFAVLSAVLFAGAASAGATPAGGRRPGSDPSLATPAATP